MEREMTGEKIRAACQEGKKKPPVSSLSFLSLLMTEPMKCNRRKEHAHDKKRRKRDGVLISYWRLHLGSSSSTKRSKRLKGSWQVSTDERFLLSKLVKQPLRLLDLCTLTSGRILFWKRVFFHILTLPEREFLVARMLDKHAINPLDISCHLLNHKLGSSYYWFNRWSGMSGVLVFMSVNDR